MKMLEKIAVYAIGIVVAIPVLLWFAIRGVFRGGWGLLTFVCLHQYQELKRLCECGTAAELQAFLTAHPGAREYIVYARQDKPTSILTTLFELPAPLAVASKADNLAVIPVLLDYGASPEVCSVRTDLSPAEEAIGNPDKMRSLCGGRTWWLECSTGNHALTGEPRSVVWNVMRDTRLTSHKELCTVWFLEQPRVMKEFICRFGIQEEQRKEFHALLKQITPQEKKTIAIHRFHSPIGPRRVSLHKEFDEMMQVMEMSLNPLPTVDTDAMERLMYSASLLERPKMLKLLDTLFTQEQQFAMLDTLTRKPQSNSDRELKEDTVDLLLCSILKKAGG